MINKNLYSYIFSQHAPVKKNYNKMPYLYMHVHKLISQTKTIHWLFTRQPSLQLIQHKRLLHTRQVNIVRLQYQTWISVEGRGKKQ